MTTYHNIIIYIVFQMIVVIVIHRYIKYDRHDIYSSCWLMPHKYNNQVQVQVQVQQVQVQVQQIVQLQHNCKLSL